MKKITRTVPVSMCVACALMTVGCDRTDTPSTSVKQANQTSVPAATVAAITPEAPVNEKLTRPVISEEALKGEPAAAPAPVFTTAVIKAEPTELDLGEIPTNDSKTGKVKLVNTSDTSVKIMNARVSCGCTTTKFVPNTVLAAHETMEVEVQLSGGAKDGPVSGKTITFVVENHPEIIVPLRAQAVSFVKAEPAALTPDSDQILTLKSIDGQPFRITSMVPQAAVTFEKEAKTEHEIAISWDDFRSQGISRQLVVYMDHPKCQQVFVTVNFSASELQKRAEEQQKQQIANQDAMRSQHGKTVSATPTTISLDDELTALIKAGETVEVLKRIQSGLDVNYRDSSGTTLLGIAAKEGNAELVRALLEVEKVDAGATDNVGRTALMHAASSKNVEAIRVLLDTGANPSLRDNLGNTALSWAAWLGDADSVRELISAGSDVEVVSAITGWTPLILASAFGEPTAVEALIDARAELDTADILEGATPLIHAARTGNPESIKVLVRRGANLESVDRTGCTAFLACAKFSGGDAEKLQLLIDSGVNVNAKDNRGLNALDLAQKRTDARKDEIIAILERVLPATPAAGE